jgi:hypothetical protein
MSYPKRIAARALYATLCVAERALIVVEHQTAAARNAVGWSLLFATMHR